MLTGHLWELIIVLVIALVIFGPKRLPELGSSLGKGIREFRKATNELQESINVHEPEPLPQSRQNYSATSDYTAPRSSVERPAPAPAPAEYVATPAHGSEHEPPSHA